MDEKYKCNDKDSYVWYENPGCYVYVSKEMRKKWIDIDLDIDVSTLMYSFGKFFLSTLPMSSFFLSRIPVEAKDFSNTSTTNLNGKTKTVTLQTLQEKQEKENLKAFAEVVEKAIENGLKKVGINMFPIYVPAPKQPLPILPFVTSKKNVPKVVPNFDYQREILSELRYFKVLIRAGMTAAALSIGIKLFWKLIKFLELTSKNPNKEIEKNLEFLETFSEGMLPLLFSLLMLNSNYFSGKKPGGEGGPHSVGLLFKDVMNSRKLLLFICCVLLVLCLLFFIRFLIIIKSETEKIHTIDVEKVEVLDENKNLEFGLPITGSPNVPEKKDITSPIQTTTTNKEIQKYSSKALIKYKNSNVVDYSKGLIKYQDPVFRNYVEQLPKIYIEFPDGSKEFLSQDKQS